MILPKVKLVSDFYGQEPYDCLFDGYNAEIEWVRNGRDGISRRKAFEILQKMGLYVPYYATVQRMYALIGHHRPLIIVYLDEMAHCSEGKEFCCLHQGTRDKYDEALAAVWIDNEGHGAISYRYLRIGLKCFGLQYCSDDRRFSNRGDVAIYHYPSVVGVVNYICLPGEFKDPYTTPMMAIDFVRSIGGMWWAVDYNTSPGIKDTPVLDLITPQEIVGSIKEYYVKHGGSNGN